MGDARGRAAISTLAVCVFAWSGAVRASRIDANVAVPMRDGVVLRADILRPDHGEKFPVLVYRTPYGKASARRDYTTFERAVERGYAVVVQDVRGRYASAGEFRPYENEGFDGFDTIEWAATQAWSTGDVGTFGLSYPGAVQWLAAVQEPPHLKAMAPAMVFSTPQNFFYAGGAWDMSWIDWIWFNIAPDVRVKKNLPGPKSDAEAVEAWKSEGLAMQRHLPLAKLAQMQGVAPYYTEWLEHPPRDPWWGWAELRDKYSRIHAAVLNLSGWYDDNYGPEGATTNFSGLAAVRGPRAGDTTRLLLGPWVHGVDNTAKTRSGERVFGANAAIDYDAVVLDFMDEMLRHEHRGGDVSPVRYYVMGADQWRNAQRWPPAATPTTFYLSAADKKPGALTQAKPRTSVRFAQFVADPQHPVLNEYASSGAHDYRRLSQRADVLTFETAPLAHDLEVTGPIDANVFIACRCRDLDLWVRLLDVAPDGTAFNVMGPGLDVQRASLERGFDGSALAAGEIQEIRLDRLLTSNVFLRGHAIRIQVSASFFPNFSRNLQTGASEVSSSDSAVARVRIYTDSKHPSAIHLPVIDAAFRKP